MKTVHLVRWKERETHEILEKALRGTRYEVSIKPRLIDVIGPDGGERLSREDHNFLRTAHLDFVVYERRGNYQPMFAVEFDGPYHQEPRQLQRDIRKNRLCVLAEFPLLRLGYVELEKHDKITLLGFMVERFVAWQQEQRRIESEIKDYVDTLSPDQFDSLTQDGIIDPSIDPAFWFDINHKFPGIKKVANRLLCRYKIVTPYHPIDAPEKLHLGDRYLSCEIMPLEESYGEGYHVIKKCSYTLFWKDPEVKHLSWGAGNLRTSGIEVLCEGAVEASMLWALPVVDDHKPKESGFECFQRVGKLPFGFADLPGVHIPDIAECFSQYLALREVEKWAEKHLPGSPPTRGEG